MELSDYERSQLEPFRFSMKQTDSPLSICVAQLFDEKDLRYYFEKLRKKIGAPNMAVAASIFIKRYSFVAVIALYAMSVWNKRLFLPFERIYLETDDTAEIWLPTFRIEPLQYTQSAQKRIQWSKETMEELFANHLSPLIGQIHPIAKIPSLILWENIAIYLFWLYETVLMKDEAFSDIAVQLNEDLQTVIQTMNLARFWEKRKKVGRRVTCCLSYQTTMAHSYCKICPLKKDHF
jgi:ferric iron reductase protein FhuF